MKDDDALNNILRYACLVEGTQYSETMSKTYLDTRIPNSSVKVDVIIQKESKQE